MTGNENLAPARWFRLREHGLIRVTGADAAAFLQGQLSNDVQAIAPDHSQLSSFNSPKGRMLAVLQLWRRADAFELEIHPGVLDATLKRLRMFVLRSKVQLDDASAATGAIGIAGGGAPSVLRALELPAPAARFEVALAQHLFVRRLDASPRFAVHGPAADIHVLQEKLAGHAPEGSGNEWKALAIEAGMPTVYPQTSDHFVPQMCNLDWLGGISFNKGCYTGQEVVARLHYLGNLKRRMFAAAAAAKTGPGTPVYDARGDAQAVGEIVDAVETAEGIRVLAVLQLNHVGGDLRLSAPDGPALSALKSFDPAA